MMNLLQSALSLKESVAIDGKAMMLQGQTVNWSLGIPDKRFKHNERMSELSANSLRDICS